MLRSLLLILALCAPLSLRAEPTFVFVHGAFVGEWYWTPVVERLRADGHAAYAVTLRGYGARADENGAEITAYDHGQDIIDFADEKALDEIILVAHSYGGLPATAALDHLRARVIKAIYIDALPPFGLGDTAIPEQRKALMTLETEDPDTWAAGLIPVPDDLKAKHPDHVLMPQSIAANYSALELQNGPLTDINGLYIIARKTRVMLYRQLGDLMQNNHGWALEVIGTGHDVVGEDPDGLVALLVAAIP